MGDVIRDVTIRVKIDQLDFTLKVPNVEQVNAALDKTNESIRTVSSTIEQSYSKLISASAASAEASKQAAATELANIQVIEQKTAIATKSEETIRKEQEKSAQDASKFRDQATKSQIEVADKLKGSAEGVFVLARGIAFLSTNSEKDFEQVLRNVAKVQGAFDLFKGSVDAVKNLYEAYRALKTAQEAAAASQLALNAATTAGSVANSTAAATAGTAAAALNPISLAVIGVTLAVGAGALAWKHYSDEAKKSKEAEETLKKQTEYATKLNAQVEALAENYAHAFSILESQGDIANQKLDLQLSEFRGNPNELDKKTIAGATATDSANRERLKETLVAGGAKRRVNRGEGFAPDEDAGIDIGSKEDRTNRVDEARKTVKNVIESDKQVTGEQGKLYGKPELESRLKTVQAIATAERQSIEIEQRVLEVYQRQGDQLRDNHKTKMEELATTKQAIVEEQKRLTSAEARFGSLDKKQQEELKAIAGKSSKGEKLSQAEALQLQQSGFGEKVATENLSRIGRDAGAESFLKQVGETGELSKLQNKENALKGEVDLLVEAINAKRDEEQEQISRITKALDQLTDYNDLLATMERLIDRKNAKAR